MQRDILLKHPFIAIEYSNRCHMRKIDLSASAQMWLNMTLNSLLLTKLGRMWREAIKLIANYLVSSRFRSHRKDFCEYEESSVDASVWDRKGNKSISRNSILNPFERMRKSWAVMLSEAVRRAFVVMQILLCWDSLFLLLTNNFLRFLSWKERRLLRAKFKSSLNVSMKTILKAWHYEHREIPFWSLRSAKNIFSRSEWKFNEILKDSFFLRFMLLNERQAEQHFHVTQAAFVQHFLAPWFFLSLDFFSSWEIVKLLCSLKTFRLCFPSASSCVCRWAKLFLVQFCVECLTVQFIRFFKRFSSRDSEKFDSRNLESRSPRDF